VKLDFILEPPHTGASVSYAGGAASLVGSNINVSEVLGLDANGAVTGSLSINPGVLSFSTGNFTGYSSASGTETWSFGSGGTIAITGSVIGLSPFPYVGTLMQGNDVSGLVSKMQSGRYSVSLLLFVDEKYSGLTDYFNLPGGWYNGELNLGFDMQKDSGDAFHSTAVYSGDVINTPVPIPPSVLLLGAGLMGIGIVRKRIK